jgi:hypothetical protein
MLRLRTVTTGRLPAGFVAFVLVAGAFCLAPPTTRFMLAAGPTPRSRLNLNLASSQRNYRPSAPESLVPRSTPSGGAAISASSRPHRRRERIRCQRCPSLRTGSASWCSRGQRPSATRTSTFAVGPEMVRHEGRGRSRSPRLRCPRIVDESIRFRSGRAPATTTAARCGARSRAVAHEIGPLPARPGARQPRPDARQHRRLGVCGRQEPRRFCWTSRLEHTCRSAPLQLPSRFSRLDRRPNGLDITPPACLPRLPRGVLFADVVALPRERRR